MARVMGRMGDRNGGYTHVMTVGRTWLDLSDAPVLVEREFERWSRLVEREYSVRLGAFREERFPGVDTVDIQRWYESEEA